MKKKLFFLPLFAALALAGCSSDEDVLNEESKVDTENTGYGYVAVNIVQPKSGFAQPNSVGTRAASDGFEYGSADENNAQTGLFFIFGSEGVTMYGQPQLLSLEGEGTGNTPEVERIYHTVLVIDGVADDPTDAAKQIVCILNPPVGIEEGVTTLAQLQAKIDNYSISEPGKFIMTNSVYKNSGRTVLGARVEDENICKSAAAALNNPVEIYVERVVAKVRATSVAKMDNTKGAHPTVDGVDKNFDIKITGIEIANIAKSAYLFKSITGINTGWTWVNDVNNKRSYWETCPSPLEYSNKSYNEIIDGFSAEATISEYIQPNTNSQKTAILVTAQLLDKDDENKPADLVYLRGGYFTQESALNLIAQYVANNGYYKGTVKTEEDGTSTTTYTQLSAGDFEWEDKHDNPALTWLKSYEVVAKVKDDVADLYKETFENGEVVWTSLDDATEINNLLKGSADNKPLYKARVYTDGMCYYFVNIDQSSVAGATAHTYDGVVRNHIYDLNLESIMGIGTPVFDPEDIIIPERPEDEELYYLAATVEVLAWRLVKQNVVFTGN